jgi:hypothetical protein
VIKPIFKKHGLAILQFPSTQVDMVGVVTKVIHVDGGSISEFVGIPASPGMNGQHAGAIISYLRRYSLASVAGIATEDDDAETDRVIRSSAKEISRPAPSASVDFERVASSAKAPSSNSTGLIVPFGKSKGKTLDELSDNDLNYWANTWEPKPWEKTGKVGAKDLALKAGAIKLWNERNSGADSESEVSDDVPF